MKIQILIGAALAAFSLCSQACGWTVPAALEEVNSDSAEEWSPFLSADGLSLYFSRVRSEDSYFGRMYVARRERPYGSFTSVRELSELNRDNVHVVCPWVSPDELRMYYHTESGAGWRLNMSERGSADEPWGAGVEISELNSLARYIQAPSLTADELTIYYQKREESDSVVQYDIWTASRANLDSPFGEARGVDEINSPVGEVHPFVSADGLSLFFVSQRKTGHWQLFEATRASADEAFGGVEHLSQFDTPGGDSQFPCMSADGRTMYFVGSQDSSVATRDIYVSYIPEPGTIVLMLLGAALCGRRGGCSRCF